MEKRPVTAARPLVWGPRLPRSGPGVRFWLRWRRGAGASLCPTAGGAPARVCISAVAVRLSAPAGRPPLPRAQLSPCPAQLWHVAGAWWMSRERGKVVRRREARTLSPYRWECWLRPTWRIARSWYWTREAARAYRSRAGATGCRQRTRDGDALQDVWGRIS